MSAHRAVTATFSQDTGDTDGDGLTNYAELVTHSTDPNDSDSDDDTLTDGEEIQVGLNPNTANTALVSFFDTRESTARSEGNTSGIAYVQANLSSYSLYTKEEKNASDATQYASGVSDGNTSGIAYVQANLISIHCTRRSKRMPRMRLSMRVGRRRDRRRGWPRYRRTWLLRDFPC